MNNWMISPGNAGKPVTIYDIPYPRAFVPNNIFNSFKCTGFFPFNENVFTETDFLTANVTDRPIVDIETSVFNNSIEAETAPGKLPSTSFIASSKKKHFRSPQNYNECFFSSAELSNVGAGNEYPMSEISKFTVMLYFFMFSFFDL